jgi:hypothetical protein
MGILKDEMNKLLLFHEEQFSAMKALVTVLSPSTYQQASKSRKSLFRLEMKVIRSTCTAIERQMVQFDELLKECENVLDLFWETRDDIGNQNTGILFFLIFISAIGVLMAYLFVSDTTHGRQERLWENLGILALGIMLFCIVIVVWRIWLVSDAVIERNSSLRNFSQMKTRSESKNPISLFIYRRIELIHSVMRSKLVMSRGKAGNEDDDSDSDSDNSSGSSSGSSGSFGR